jgi:probable rRNA maturation factor
VTPVNRPNDSQTTEVSVKLRIEGPAAWAAAVPGAQAVVRKAAVAAWLAAGPDGAVELSVVLGDDALLRRLNHRYRGCDTPTNVLSFAMGDGLDAGTPRLAGDVVIAVETLLREADAQGKTPAEHLGHLVVHGVLHLAGFDHSEPAAANEMERIEIDVLASLDIKDPYFDGRDVAE